jgi:pilus assembly protein CpaE
VEQGPVENQKGAVIGVFSPKGGVGKTTIATNLAVGLGQLAPMSVVLVDLDLQFGDVASGLYLNPERTVTDAVSPAAAQDTLVLKAFLTVHPASIYALCAPVSPVEADFITPEQVTRLLEQLAEEFQYVVVDTAPGLPEIGLAAMEACTDVVWVSAMDVPSVRGLRSGMDILRQLEILPEGRHVVLNMADSKCGLSVQDIEATIGAPVDVSVPRSRAVALSTNRGVPVLLDAKKDPATKGLSQLVNRLGPAAAKQQRSTHRRVVV